MPVFIRRGQNRVFPVRIDDPVCRRPIVVRCDDKFHVRRHWLAFEFQVFNPIRVRIDHILVFVVFRRLGDIDLVRHAINNVEVVRREVVVDKRLNACLVRVDLVELPRRPLKPFFQLGSRNFQRIHRVRIQVQIGDVFNGDFPCRDVGIIARPAASAGFERSAGRQHRKAFIFRPFQHLFNIPFLRIRDDLHGRIVFDKRKIAVDRARCFSNRAADVLNRRFMFRLDRLLHGRVAVNQRRFRRLVVHRAKLGFRLRHFPFSIDLLNRQINNPKRIAPRPRHRHRNTVDRACFIVDTVPIRKIGRRSRKRRKFFMLVAGQHGVDPRNLRQIIRCVFHIRAVSAGLNARVR
ncbi:hypothetical protein TGS27_3047 [Geobacillus stearothermophilus]|nr:hypothetical protein TGS27_3047 [Geobacillus stearothermophilus]